MRQEGGRIELWRWHQAPLMAFLSFAKLGIWNGNEVKLVLFQSKTGKHWFAAIAFTPLGVQPGTLDMPILSTSRRYKRLQVYSSGLKMMYTQKPGVKKLISSSHSSWRWCLEGWTVLRILPPFSRSRIPAYPNEGHTNPILSDNDETVLNVTFPFAKHFAPDTLT